MTNYAGQCHCGNVTVAFTTEKAIGDLGPRVCTCSYCQRQGARYTSDPGGSIALSLNDPQAHIRYRFGTEQADFVICNRCGIYVGAVAEEDGAQRMVLNINVLDDAGDFSVPEDFTYDGEAPDERKTRWFTRWTPVVINL